MKKVCHITTVHQSDDIRIFRKECRSLAAAGYQVVLLSARGGDREEDGVRVIGLNAVPKGRLKRMFFDVNGILEKALQLKADVYHIHDPELLRVVGRLKSTGAKVIYDAHENVAEQIMGKYWINKNLRTLVATSFRSFEDKTAKGLDHIITATPSIRERFREINPKATDINNYPLKNELFDQAGWDSKQNEVCYVGGMTEIRGVVEMITALEFTDGIKLNIAGLISPEDLRRKLMKLPGWEKLKEYGQVGRDQVTDIMRRSVAGLVLFHALPNHINAQPNKLFEYMSAGIPVIASAFPLWKELLERHNCGITVDQQNPEEIAGAINKLINNKELAKELGNNGRKAIEEYYNWERESEKLIDIYKRVLK